MALVLVTVPLLWHGMVLWARWRRGGADLVPTHALEPLSAEDHGDEGNNIGEVATSSATAPTANANAFSSENKI